MCEAEGCGEIDAKRVTRWVVSFSCGNRAKQFCGSGLNTRKYSTLG